MKPQKRILIVAGPNGAGKTTFAKEHLLKKARCFIFINADLIADGLNPFQPELAAFKAGRLMLEMIDESVSSGETFAFETTLSGRGYARSIPRWKQQGYRVELHFVRLRSADLAVQRVQLRVAEGGHHVPEDVIRRRFRAGWHNFQHLYRGLVSAWSLHDNSGRIPVLFAEGENK